MKTFSTAATLAEAVVEKRALKSPGLTFVDGRTEPQTLTWQELAREAMALGGALRRRGTERGERVGLALSNPRQFAAAFLGCVAHGIVPVPLAPPPLFGELTAYVGKLGAVLAAAECSQLLIQGDLGAQGAHAAHADSLRALAPALREVVTREVLQPCRRDEDLATPTTRPDDPCFLQFTSGSTSAPKGVIVSHHNLVSNAHATHDRLDSDPQTDVGVSWLPLHHDMGLIGSLVTPTLSGGRQVLIPTHTFATRPQIWLQAIHEHGGTLTATNNFGLRAATKRPPRIAGLDLSRLRAVVVGAEPINPTTIAQFTDAYAAAGLRPHVICPAYGLAEATLCAAAQGPGEPPRVLRIDRAEYEAERRARESDATDACAIVGCGAALSQHELSIRGSAGAELSAGEVGEIWVRGPSVTSGYYDRGVVTPHPLTEGWLATGDLGFLDRGELFVSGRKKDLVIVAGRNHDPHDIEREVAVLDNLRPEHVAAFSVGSLDGEQLVIAAECRNPGRIDGLEERVKKLVLRRIGIRPRDVVLLRPWTLPMTSSGKLQRGRTRAAYEAGELARLERTSE